MALSWSVCLVLLTCFILRFRSVSGQDELCSCQVSRGCNFMDICRPSTGNCNERNVALGKAASVSSLYKGPGEVSGPACLAVNGNTNTTFRDIRRTRYNPNCVHTADPDLNPFWEVDLGREFLISSITVYGQEETFFLQRNILRYATLMVDDQLCYTFPRDEKLPVMITTTCSTTLKGRRVRLQKNTSNDNFQFITLCELQVWVNCSLNGFYGANCTECGHCSRDVACDVRTGSCSGGCYSGWRGDKCKQECTAGFFGPDCRHACGLCSAKEPCNRVSGECPSGCMPGYRTQHCNKSCTAGSFGDGCNETCGFCKNRICDSVTGYCPDGCDVGWQGEMCIKPCSNNTYGERCSKTCGHCSNATQCNTVTGHCDSCPTEFDPPFCDARQVTACQSRTGSIAGAVVGCVAAFVIGLLVGRLSGRPRAPKGKEPKYSSDKDAVKCSSDCRSNLAADLFASQGDEDIRQTANVYEWLQKREGGEDSSRAAYTGLVFKARQRDNTANDDYINTNV